MKTSDLGKRTSSTPPYGTFSKEKQDKQSYGTFIQKGKQFPDGQDLMGGPKPLRLLSPSEKAFYAKQKLGEVAMRSFGRYHD